MMTRPIRRALLSVSDKTGLLDLARTLHQLGAELTSTGGTRKALAEAGLPVKDISELTGFPEMLDGRVKTLHPRVHGGILYIRGNAQHQATVKEHQIQPIDLVVCNLYPFEATVAKPGSTHEEIVENIDIGGPSMVRSASKNYHDVAIVTDPAQYPAVIEELHANQGLCLETRERLAAAAFAAQATYDRAIAAYFATRASNAGGEGSISPSPWGEGPGVRGNRCPTCSTCTSSGASTCATARTRISKRPSMPSLASRRRRRHGRVPARQGAFLQQPSRPRQRLQPGARVRRAGRHRHQAQQSVRRRRRRHAGGSLSQGLRGRSLSAYGGVLGFNREIDEATATQITEPNRFVECVIAPGYSEAAFQLLTTRPTWKKSVRLLKTGPIGAAATTLDYRRIDGGLLVQARDRGSDDFGQLKTATKRAPTPAELADLRFAWLVCKHVKSNAIVLAKDGMVVGVGAGQMSRVDSVHMAVRKAGERSQGSVLASDAFFPFRDNIDEAAKAGVTAVIQPGGSMRDADSIAACDEHGMAMLLTGIRHFRH